jgi:deoxyhypusine synthase
MSEADLNEAREAVLAPSEDVSEHNLTEVKGYDFNQGIDYSKILDSYLTTGFQATHFGKAVEVSVSILCFYHIYRL